MTTASQSVTSAPGQTVTPGQVQPQITAAAPVLPSTSAPPAATATPTSAPSLAIVGGTVCSDGWVSESTGSGTCSSHGGIANSSTSSRTTISAPSAANSDRSCYGCISPSTDGDGPCERVHAEGRYLCLTVLPFTSSEAIAK